MAAEEELNSIMVALYDVSNAIRSLAKENCGRQPPPHHSTNVLNKTTERMRSAIKDYERFADIQYEPGGSEWRAHEQRKLGKLMATKYWLNFIEKESIFVCD